MDITSFLGYFSALCTTFAYFPQAYKVYKTKQTGDISLGMFLLLNTGIIGWCIYGYLLSSIPMVAGNIICLTMSLYILYMKMKELYNGK